MRKKEQDPVLILLLLHDDYISGENIGDKLGISRAAVWKHIKSIESRGMEVESLHGKGYRIYSIPDDKLITERIITGYRKKYGTEFPFSIFYRDKAASTNKLSKEWVVENKAETPFVLLTDYQYDGRGRMGRVWQFEQGKDIAATLVYHQNMPLHLFYQITMMVSLSIYETVSPYVANQECFIKWPNDIYVGEKKLCGILSEMISEEGMIQTLITGFGININSDPQIEKAVSLKQSSGGKIDRHQLLIDIFHKIHSYFQCYQKGDFKELYCQWKTRVGLIGKPVSIKTTKEMIHGILEDIQEDGAVVLNIEGKSTVFYSGDLVVN